MENNNQERPNLRKPKRELRQMRALLAVLTEQSTPAWLSSEHYLLSGMCRSVIDRLKSCPRVPYVDNPKRKSVPYAFAVSETIPPRADTEEMISVLSHFKPDEAFLRWFPTMRAAAVLCRIAQCCDNPEPPQAFGAWMDQLRQTKEVDWATVHDRLSAVEQILMQDPCGAYPK